MGEGSRGAVYEAYADIIDARFDAARDCSLKRPADYEVVKQTCMTPCLSGRKLPMLVTLTLDVHLYTSHRPTLSSNLGNHFREGLIYFYSNR